MKTIAQMKMEINEAIIKYDAAREEMNAVTNDIAENGWNDANNDDFGRLYKELAYMERGLRMRINNIFAAHFGKESEVIGYIKNMTLTSAIRDFRDFFKYIY